MVPNLLLAREHRTKQIQLKVEEKGFSFVLVCIAVVRNKHQYKVMLHNSPNASGQLKRTLETLSLSFWRGLLFFSVLVVPEERKKKKGGSKHG